MKPCAKPIGWDKLVAYWLGELPAQEEEAVEAHYFACASCARRLDSLAAYAQGIRAAVREGRLWAIVTPAFLEHMKREGLRVREHPAVPGERVECTLLAGDDAVVGRMRLPLTGVRRLDVLQRLEVGDRIEEWRAEDVPFDADAGEVVLLPSAAALRHMPANVARIRLVAVDEVGERALGEITFAHTPG